MFRDRLKLTGGKALDVELEHYLQALPELRTSIMREMISLLNQDVTTATLQQDTPK